MFYRLIPFNSLTLCHFKLTFTCEVDVGSNSKFMERYLLDEHIYDNDPDVCKLSIVALFLSFSCETSFCHALQRAKPNQSFKNVKP